MNVFQIGAEDRIYCCLPLFHSAGGGLVAGATLVLARKFSARRFWEEVCHYQCTVVQYIGESARWLVNAAQGLSPEQRRALQQRHCVRAAVGNGMRPEVFGPFMDGFRIPTVCEFYGATEGNGTVVNVCSARAARGAVGRQGALLRAVQGYRIVKFDVDTEALVRTAEGRCVEYAPGEAGELIMPIIEGKAE